MDWYSYFDRKLRMLNPKKAILVLFFIFVGIFTVWFYTLIVTHGEMNLFTREYMGINYVNTWDQLLKGRIDLDPAVIDFGETYYHNGKRYMYFGPFPGFVRGIFSVFPRFYNTDWSRISNLIAAIVILLSCTFAFRRVAGYFYTILFFLVFAYGSYNVILLTSSYVYHEAIIWGLANVCVFIWAFINFWFSDRIGLLLLLAMSLSSGFALLSRASFGIFPFLVILLLIFVLFLSNLSDFFKNKVLKSVLNWLGWKKTHITVSRLLLAYLVLIIPTGLSILFQVKLNYEKMGNPFVMMDYHYYEKTIADKGRLQLWLSTKGVMDYSRIPHSVVFHLIPHKEHFSDKFPFIEIFDYRNIFKFKDTWFDVIEPGNPAIIHTPFLFFTSVIGLFLLVSAYGGIGIFLFLALVISNLFFFSFQAMTGRYTADLMPTFLIFSFAAIKFFNWTDKKGGKLKISVRIIFLLLALLSIYTANMTMLKFKLNYWSVPEHAKPPIRNFFKKADNYISIFASKKVSQSGVLEVLRFDDKNVFPSYPVTGQLWTPDGDETLFWFDGKNWSLIRDDGNKYLGPVTLKVLFKPRHGESEPLVSTGVPGSGDTIYVKYLSATTGQVCYDHWGVEGFPSNIFQIDPNRAYIIEVSFGSFYPGIDLGALSRNVIVKVDGMTLLDRPTGFHATKPEQIVIGKNQVDCGVCGLQFTGEIIEARRAGMRIIYK